MRHEAIRLWQGSPPGSEDWTHAESELQFMAGMPVMLRNVVHPTVTPVLPDPSVATGVGVLVCPGGGYTMLAMEHEGFAVADWLAERGVAAFVLKYRVQPMDTSPEEALAALAEEPAATMIESIFSRMDEFAAIPLTDGAAAMTLIRDRAAEWGVVPNRIGAVGFSAGGRLVLDLASHDQSAVRPAFVGAIYPAPSPHPVRADAPPLFVAAAADDPIFPISVDTHTAWRAADRKVEAHFYNRGGHGFGMNRLSLPCDSWIEQFAVWMTSEGFRTRSTNP